MNIQFKRKLYALGTYLLSNKLEDEFLGLLKISQSLNSGEMPGLELIEKSKVVRKASGLFNATHPERSFIDEFLNLNSNIFSIYTPVKRLGGGVDGEAYILDDGRVIKLFQAPGLLKFYKEERDRLFDQTAGKETLMIYDVGIFEMPEDFDYFIGWAITEFVQTNFNIFSDDLYVRLNYFIYYNVGCSNITDLSSDNLRTIAESAWKSFRERFPEDEKSTHYLHLDRSLIEKNLNQPKHYNIKNDSDHIIRYIMSLIYSNAQNRVDTHEGNFGYRHETPVFFDPYHPKDKENEEELEKIKSNPDMKIASEISNSGNMPDFEWIEKSLPVQGASRAFENSSEWINRFLDLNSDIIINWDIDKKLGNGCYGQAWLLKDGNVLKIFTDTAIIEEYKRLESAPFDPETGSENDLRVYDYGVFIMPDLEYNSGYQFLNKEIKEKGSASIDLGYVIIEPLKTADKFSLDYDSDLMENKSMDTLIGVIENFARNYHKVYIDELNPLNMEDAINKLDYILSRPRRRKIFHSVKEIRDSAINSYGLPNDWIEKLLHSIFRSLDLNNRDIKSDNIGYRGDTPVYFDSATPSHIYKLPDDLQKVRNWDKDAKEALLREYLGIKIPANIIRNADLFSEKIQNADPGRIKYGRYGIIFNSKTRIRRFVDEAFNSPNKDRDYKSKQAWVDMFLDQNSDLLSKYDPVKHLGSGVYADAWETDDGKVIKIIRDDKDLPFYKEQQDALHSGKGTPENIMVYDMGTFDVPWAQEPYDIRKIKSMSWVVIEKLKPLRGFINDYDEQLEDLAKFLKNKDSTLNIDGGLLKAFKRSFGLMKVLIETKVASNPSKMGAHKAETELYISNIKKWFFNSDEYKDKISHVFQDAESKIGLPKGWLNGIIDSMIVHLINGDNDLHSGNVGFRGNQPVYFDPSNRIPNSLSPEVSYVPSTTVNDSSKTIFYDRDDEEDESDTINETFVWEH
jgi:hypothetical protein